MKTDIVIIGAGPTGLFAVFEAGMLEMKCCVVDPLDFVGGQCSALYPEKPIYDIPAYPKIGAQELIDKLMEQIAPFKPEFHLGQQVMEVVKSDGGFIVKTSKGLEISCKAIIIAAGCGAFGPNRPPIHGIEEFEGKSVFYMIQKKEIFTGKKVVIAGGGDSAVDWAIVLSEIAKSVKLVHRRDSFRAAPESERKLRELQKEGKIEIVTPYQLENLKGNNGMLSQVILKDLDSGIKEIDADFLLPFYGLAMKIGPIAEWGLELTANHLIKVQQSHMETNIPGIFAIGDIANYENKLKLILSGFSEAATACHSAYKIVNPEKVYHFEYSTSKGVK